MLMLDLEHMGITMFEEYIDEPARLAQRKILATWQTLAILKNRDILVW